MLADSCIFRFLFESPKREAREIVSWKIILVHQFYVNKYELGLDFAYTFLLRNHAWETCSSSFLFLMCLVGPKT